MAKYIAHASIDERGKIKGGSSGDQTAKEVCIRTWYNKPWNYVLRIKNTKVRKQFANNMIDLAKANYAGYDQNQRNTLLTQAKKVNFDFSKITTKCECDCSSAVTICILGAIYKVLGKEEYEKAYKVLVVDGNCATTSTLRSRLNKLDMINAYSNDSYTDGTSKAVFGDIYIKEGSHVVCYIDDGNKVSLSSTSSSTSTSKPSSSKTNKIKEWQKAAIADGFSFPKFGADGEWGSECETVAKKAICKKRLVYKYKNLTKIVQKTVCVEADGKFGQGTKDAVIKFQKKNGLTADGEVGLKTWKKILNIE